MANRPTDRIAASPRAGRALRPRRIADHADRHDLYLRAVQSPEHEVQFFLDRYREAFGATPRTLREDFCGTFAVCCAWVKRVRNGRAIGVDLDKDTLDWGRTHLLAACSPGQRERVKLLQCDVRSVSRPAADVVAAENFSFWALKTRAELLEYFRAAHRGLARKGLLVLDMMGGVDSMRDGRTDTRPINEPVLIPGNPRRFDYRWEQVSFDPVSHECRYAIHFRFRDGSVMRRAFEYHWRYWTLPEVRDALIEAGFTRADVFWDVSESGDDGEYERRDSAPNDPAWVCYIVATKGQPGTGA